MLSEGTYQKPEFLLLDDIMLVEKFWHYLFRIIKYTQYKLNQIDGNHYSESVVARPRFQLI